MIRINKDVLAEVERAGFVLVRSNGHHIFRHPVRNAVLTVANSPRYPQRQLQLVRQDIRRAFRACELRERKVTG